MHNISNLFYFGTTLYMFQTVFPSIIRSTYSIRYMSYRFCACLLASRHRTCFWWWTERPSVTCRVLSQNKINLRYCASGWFYYRNILRCTVLQTSKKKLWFQSNTTIHFIYFYPDDMFRANDQHQTIFTKLRIRCTQCK